MTRTIPGLTDEQIARLRVATTGARKPRVSLLGTQFGTDASGQVVSVGDPAVDGDEFISVSVKIGGVADTLSFGPGELSIPSSKGAKVTPASARLKPLPTPSTQKTPAPPAALATPRARPSAPSQSAAQPPTPPTGTRKRATPAKRRPPNPVTITVASTGNTWQLSAQRGGRTLVKSIVLAPGVVTAMAELCADSSLQEAVAEINDVSLTQAQVRAQQLRDELAEVESLLKAHQRPGTSTRR